MVEWLCRVLLFLGSVWWQWSGRVLIILDSNLSLNNVILLYRPCAMATRSCLFDMFSQSFQGGEEHL